MHSSIQIGEPSKLESIQLPQQPLNTLAHLVALGTQGANFLFQLLQMLHLLAQLIFNTAGALVGPGYALFRTSYALFGAGRAFFSFAGTFFSRSAGVAFAAHYFHCTHNPLFQR
jgi:hypothetical protein